MNILFYIIWQYLFYWWLGKSRSGSRAAATSTMVYFQPLTIITKRSILDGTAALDPPLSTFFFLMLTRVKLFDLLDKKLQNYVPFQQTRDFYRSWERNIAFAKDSFLKIFLLFWNFFFLGFKVKFKISVKFCHFEKCFSISKIFL